MQMPVGIVQRKNDQRKKRAELLWNVLIPVWFEWQLGSLRFWIMQWNDEPPRRREAWQDVVPKPVPKKMFLRLLLLHLPPLFLLLLLLLQQIHLQTMQFPLLSIYLPIPHL